jgi:hypothetical protein
MSRVIHVISAVLLLACHAQARKARQRPSRAPHGAPKSIQFTITTTDGRTKEVKEHLSVRIERSEDINVVVNADDEMVEGMLGFGRSLTAYALNAMAREMANGFYALPAEERMQLWAQLREALGHPGEGEQNAGSHEKRRRQPKGQRKKADPKKKAGGKPGNAAAPGEFQGLADAFFGKGAVQEQDVRTVIEGFLKSDLLKELARGAGAGNQDPAEKKELPPLEW